MVSDAVTTQSDVLTSEVDARIRRIRLRPLHRMLLTITTGLLCGILLVGTAFVLVGQPNGNLDNLRHRVVVAENALDLDA